MALKREFLKEQGISDAVADKIMAEYGQTIEAHKSELAKAQESTTALQSQLDAATAQLAEAGKQIEGFKGMDIDGIKKAADDYKAAAEKAKADAAAQVEALRFDHALERAVAGFNVHDPADILHRLDRTSLKAKEDGTITGLKEQMESLQTNAAHLFKSVAPDPKIVSGSQQPPDTKEPLSGFLAAVYKGAGLPPKQ